MIDLKQRIEGLSPQRKVALANRIRAHVLTARQNSAPLVEDDRLVAYVVADDARSISSDRLRTHVAERLPEYMVPWTIIEIPSLPLMPNGKVDRHALPDPTSITQTTIDEFIEPRTELERTIANIWADQLGVECIGVRDEFFELGGNSLIAVRLFARINDACNVNLRLSVLFEHPTVEQLANVIEAERSKRSTSHADVVKIDPSLKYVVEMNSVEPSTKTPLFLVAGMLGVVHNLQPLADRIGKGRRIYGLQARGLAGEAEPHQTLEEMADAYVDEVVKVQPQGPYLVGGFCAGGFVGLEIAKRLRKRGQEVEQVVMLDTYSFPHNKSAKITWSDKIKIHYQRLKATGLHYPFVWARNLIKWEFGLLRKWLAGPTTDPAERVGQAFYQAAWDYRLQNYDGKVTIFRPPLMPECVLGPNRIVDKDRLFLYEDNNLGTHIPNLTLYETSGGDHDSFVLEPFVDSLAEKLLEGLDKA